MKTARATGSSARFLVEQHPRATARSYDELVDQFTSFRDQRALG